MYMKKYQGNEIQNYDVTMIVFTDINKSTYI